MTDWPSLLSTPNGRIWFCLSWNPPCLYFLILSDQFSPWLGRWILWFDSLLWTLGHLKLHRLLSIISVPSSVWTLSNSLNIQTVVIPLQTISLMLLIWSWQSLSRLRDYQVWHELGSTRADESSSVLSDREESVMTPRILVWPVGWPVLLSAFWPSRGYLRRTSAGWGAQG